MCRPHDTCSVHKSPPLSPIVSAAGPNPALDWDSPIHAANHLLCFAAIAVQQLLLSNTGTQEALPEADHCMDVYAIAVPSSLLTCVLVSVARQASSGPE
jgi:hypothetical protein